MSSDQLVVSAASSLEAAFTEYADAAGIDAKQSFAGSDELAAQIRQGIKPDVYAAANTTLPDELYKEGLVEKPVVFATNSLVLAVPDGSGITSIEDLTGPAPRSRSAIPRSRWAPTPARCSTGFRPIRPRRSSTTCAPRSPTCAASSAS